MQYERFTGNAPNVYNGTITFNRISKQVDITVWDNNMDFCASYDGEAAHLEGDIEVPAGSTLMVPLACRTIKVRNHTSGQTARYEIIAWYIPTEYA